MHQLLHECVPALPPRAARPADLPSSPVVSFALTTYYLSRRDKLRAAKGAGSIAGRSDSDVADEAELDDDDIIKAKTAAA